MATHINGMVPVWSQRLHVRTSLRGRDVMFNAGAGPYPWVRRRGAGSSHLIQDSTSPATDARRILQESADGLSKYQVR